MSTSTEVQPNPPVQLGSIRNARTGSFSHNTRLDETVAERIMAVSQMRHDIVILDSKPESNTNITRPSSDTLALRGTSTLRLPTDFRKGPFALYELYHDVKNVVETADGQVGIVEAGGNFELMVKNAEIERILERGGPKRVDEYRDSYVDLVDQSVRLGVVEAVFKEKMGVSGHTREYLQYLYTIGIGESFAGPDSSALIIGAAAYLFTNIFANRDRWQFGPGFYNDRSILGALFLPIVPVDHFVKGAFVLATNRLVIPTED